MGIKSLFEKNALNKIKKKGYTDEQVKVMYEAMLSYPHIIDFIDLSYSPEEIKEVLTFFKYEDAPSVAHLFNLGPLKRILMVEAYNKFVNLNPKINNEIFRLCYDVALSYDEAVLKKVIEKAITDKPDYEFLNTIKNAMQNNVNLHDLSYFKESKNKTI